MIYLFESVYLINDPRHGQIQNKSFSLERSPLRRKLPGNNYLVTGQLDEEQDCALKRNSGKYMI